MRVPGRRRRTRPADPKHERSFTIVSDCTSAKCSGESKSTGVGMLGLTNQLGGVLGAAISGGLLASTGYERIAYRCLGTTAVSVLAAGLFARQLRVGDG